MECNKTYSIYPEKYQPLQFQSIDENKVTAIEIFIDELNEKLPALKDFVVPGVNKSSAFTHQSRAICRRAERELFKLAEEKEVE